MKRRNEIIIAIVALVLVIVLWDRFADFGAEIYVTIAAR